MPPAPNLFADLPASLPEELSDTLLRSGGFRLERIISHGHSSPEGFWYDQDDHEWVLLLSGTAQLQFEGEPPFDLLPGSYVNIPSHKRHRVESTAPDQVTVWLAIFYKA